MCVPCRHPSGAFKYIHGTCDVGSVIKLEQVWGLFQFRRAYE